MTAAVDSPQPTAAVRADAIEVRLGGPAILRELSLELTAGSLTALLGPNGAGKTTLLRTLAGLIAPTVGQVFLSGRALPTLSRAEIARGCAYLPQQTPSDFELTVRQTVLTGRYAHLSRLGGLSSADFAAVDSALARAGVAELAERTLPSLSGGQRQRVLLARTLAQESPILLLDEPTASLDIAAGWEVMELLAELAAAGRTVLASVHDLSLAGEVFPRAVLLTEGRVAAAGAMAEVLSGPALAAAFGVRAERPDETGHWRFRRVGR